MNTINKINVNGTTYQVGGSAYENKSAVQNGTDESIVTTGEKYIWYSKQSYISDLANIRNGAEIATALSAWAKDANKPSYTYQEVNYTVETTTSAGGALTIDGSKPLHIIDLTGNVSGVTLSTIPASGHSTHVIFTAAAQQTVFIAHDATASVCPGATSLELTISAGGYTEVDFLNAGDKIFVRGI